MLTSHHVTSATDAKNYYAASDYYTDGQELVGKWGGKLAHEMGLSGTVDKQSFDRLVDNLHPATGKQLTPRNDHDRKIAYDLTFSGPKSFSVIEAFASDIERERLLAAFDEAVAETVERDIEPDMQTRVRKGGMDTDRTTGNMLWAGFDHATARPEDGKPPDPHRHKHVLIFSATHDPVENRIKAGQFGNIVRDKPYYEAAFYARLAEQARRPGLCHRPPGRQGMGDRRGAAIGHRQIQQADAPQIEAEAEQRGITDARQQSGTGGQDPLEETKGADAGGAAHGVGCPAHRRRTRSVGGGLPA